MTTIRYVASGEWKQQSIAETMSVINEATVCV